MTTPKFRYIDLFAGIGGFHAVLDSMGGECVYAVEIDPAARSIYEANWGISALGRNATGDIKLDADEGVMKVPEHDVLVAGFPCQPFSKSGAQRGMDEARGTLFFNIMEIVEQRKPSIVLLENVRNLAGPRHAHEWKIIIKALRQAGYRVSETPAIFNPARIKPEFGGHPQTRDRVFISATRIPVETYGPNDPAPNARADVAPVALRPSVRMTRPWDLRQDLPLIEDKDLDGTAVTEEEWRWINHWDLWVTQMRTILTHEAALQGVPAASLPGHPIWANTWTLDERLQGHLLRDASAMPWKQVFLKKNFELYERLVRFDPAWTANWLATTRSFPESRQKFEWQAQKAEHVRDCVISLRPSGLRVKQMTHLPALVAITQTPILGPLSRRLSITEAARIQGLPDEFSFEGQRGALTYKQLGNGVNTGVVAQVLDAHVRRDNDLLVRTRHGQDVLAAVTSTMELAMGDLREAIKKSVRNGQARSSRIASGGNRLG